MILKILFLIFLTNEVIACPEYFKPKNEKGFKQAIRLNQTIPTQPLSTVSKTEFLDALYLVSSVYEPVFTKRGLVLSVNGNWEDPAYDAYANSPGDDSTIRDIYISGGTARRPYMTKDALILTLCHEVGHHIGGFPTVQMIGWEASNEGQADYFATAKCMKNIFKDQKIENAMFSLFYPVGEMVNSDCSSQYLNIDEQNICYRISNTSEQHAKYLYAYNYPRIPEDLRILSDLDDTVVDFTQNTHPNESCRLLTYYQGALCNVDPTYNISIENENDGVCTLRNGDLLGARPLCWFKPSK